MRTKSLLIILHEWRILVFDANHLWWLVCFCFLNLGEVVIVAFVILVVVLVHQILVVVGVRFIICKIGALLDVHI